VREGNLAAKISKKRPLLVHYCDRFIKSGGNHSRGDL